MPSSIPSPGLAPPPPGPMPLAGVGLYGPASHQHPHQMAYHAAAQGMSGPEMVAYQQRLQQVYMPGAAGVGPGGAQRPDMSGVGLPLGVPGAGGMPMGIPPLGQPGYPQGVPLGLSMGVGMPGMPGAGGVPGAAGVAMGGMPGPGVGVPGMMGVGVGGAHMAPGGILPGYDLAAAVHGAPAGYAQQGYY